MDQSRYVGGWTRRLARVLRMPHDAWQRGKAAWIRHHIRVNPQAVFILGNQKSGTTAIAALLAKATGKSITLDIFYNLPARIEMALLTGELPLSRFVAENPQYFATDLVKEPGLTFVYEPLSTHFPQARSVLCLRDPRDNIRSMLNRVNLPGRLDRLTPEHWQAVPNLLWKHILEGRLFGCDGVNYIDTLARRWNRALAVYERHHDRVILARYEDFVVDKTGFIASLARRLGMESRHDISAHVDVQYQPRGDHTVTWEEFFGPANLQIIERTCAEGMRAHGYAPVTE
ncbi:MAG TPA: sulfotransferase [Phycisphaerales bacterium]|nr:sulfotransferase [Phycisphaerales bacterium]